MKIVHAIRAEDLMMMDMIEIMDKYLKEQNREKAIIYREEFSIIAGRINDYLHRKVTHLIEL